MHTHVHTHARARARAHPTRLAILQPQPGNTVIWACVTKPGKKKKCLIKGENK